MIGGKYIYFYILLVKCKNKLSLTFAKIFEAIYFFNLKLYT